MELSPTPIAILLAREWRQTMASINNSIERAHVDIIIEKHDMHRAAELLNNGLLKS